MEKKFIYNDAMDSLALEQLAELEAAMGKSLDAPEYSRLELDDRTLEIMIDCLEAGLDAYEDDEDAGEDATARIEAVLQFLKA